MATDFKDVLKKKCGLLLGYFAVLLVILPCKNALYMEGELESKEVRYYLYHNKPGNLVRDRYRKIQCVFCINKCQYKS